MLHLFSLTGEPSESHRLLMNGDLVDRGSWSMEVILTALAFKCTRLVPPSRLPTRLIICRRVVSKQNVHQSRKP